MPGIEPIIEPSPPPAGQLPPTLPDESQTLEDEALLNDPRDVEDDDLIVEDEALAAAAAGSNLSRGRRRLISGRFVAALSLAVLIHVAAAIILFVLFARIILFRLPRLSFAQGSSGNQSGLIHERSMQTDSPAAGVPGPALVAPISQAPTPLSPWVPANDAQPAFAHRTAGNMEIAPKRDSALIGLATSAPRAAPHWRDRAPRPVPSPAPTGGGAIAGSASHSPRPLAQADHRFIAPHGMGYGGRGDQGTGIDSRGLPVPEYPPESRRRHEEGTVQVEVRVEADGAVAQAAVLKTSGFPRLDSAALAAIRAARFAPGILDDHAVAARVIIPFRFVLE